MRKKSNQWLKPLDPVLFDRGVYKRCLTASENQLENVEKPNVILEGAGIFFPPFPLEKLFSKMASRILFLTQ